VLPLLLILAVVVTEPLGVLLEVAQTVDQVVRVLWFSGTTLWMLKTWDSKSTAAHKQHRACIRFTLSQRLAQ
jgi:hypothetical protein